MKSPLKTWLVAACAIAGFGCTEGTTSQVLTGRVTTDGAIAVRAVDGDTVITAGRVRTDGSFTLSLPKGHRYRLQVLTTSGVQNMVGFKDSGLVDLAFEVCEPTDPFDMGGVGQPSCDPMANGMCVPCNAGDPGCGGGTEPWPCDPMDPNSNCEDPPPPCQPGEPNCWPCDPMTDPTCGGQCDPSDPSCGGGGTCGSNDPMCEPPPPCQPGDPNCEPCDPMTDPTCGGQCDPMDPMSKCDPEPCQPGDPNCEPGCDPMTDPTCPTPPPPCDDPMDPQTCKDPCVLDPMFCGCGSAGNDGTMPTDPDDGNTCWPQPDPCTGANCMPGDTMTPEFPPGDFGCNGTMP